MKRTNKAREVVARYRAKLREKRRIRKEIVPTIERLWEDMQPVKLTPEGEEEKE